MIDAPSSKMAWAALFLFASAQTPATAAKKFTDQQRRYWAFQKVVKPPLPAVKRRDWARNPIDAFILANLEEKGVSLIRPPIRSPSFAAHRST